MEVVDLDRVKSEPSVKNEHYSDQGLSASTKRQTERESYRFESFIRGLGETRQIEDIPGGELDALLVRYIPSLRKGDGGDYNPGTVQSYVRGLDRYLKIKGYGKSILHDCEFENSRKVLADKKADLSSLVSESGEGPKSRSRPKKSDALTEQEEEQLWATGTLGPTNPASLRNAMWFLVSKYFGTYIRTNKDHHSLRWGNLQERRDNSGKSYIGLTFELSASAPMHFKAKVFENKENSARCPVNLYRLYRDKRPLWAKHPRGPFYLIINLNRGPFGHWYNLTPMTLGTITKIMGNMAQEAGLDRRKSNGCVVKSVHVRKAQVPVKAIYVKKVKVALHSEKKAEMSLDREKLAEVSANSEKKTLAQQCTETRSPPPSQSLRVRASPIDFCDSSSDSEEESEKNSMPDVLAVCILCSRLSKNLNRCERCGNNLCKTTTHHPEMSAVQPPMRASSPFPSTGYMLGKSTPYWVNTPTTTHWPVPGLPPGSLAAEKIAMDRLPGALPMPCQPVHSLSLAPSNVTIVRLKSSSDTDRERARPAQPRHSTSLSPSTPPTAQLKNSSDTDSRERARPAQPRHSLSLSPSAATLAKLKSSSDTDSRERARSAQPRHSPSLSPSAQPIAKLKSSSDTDSRERARPAQPRHSPSLSPSTMPTAQLKSSADTDRERARPAQPRHSPSLSPSTPPTAQLKNSSDTDSRERARPAQPLHNPTLSPSAPPSTQLKSSSDTDRERARPAQPRHSPSLSPSAPPSTQLKNSSDTDRERARPAQPRHSPSPSPNAPPNAQLKNSYDTDRERARPAQPLHSPSLSPSAPPSAQLKNSSDTDRERARPAQPRHSLSRSPTAPPSAQLKNSSDTDRERARPAQPRHSLRSPSAQLKNSSDTDRERARPAQPLRKTLIVIKKHLNPPTQPSSSTNLNHQNRFIAQASSMTIESLSTKLDSVTKSHILEPAVPTSKPDSYNNVIEGPFMAESTSLEPPPMHAVCGCDDPPPHLSTTPQIITIQPLQGHSRVDRDFTLEVNQVRVGLHKYAESCKVVFKDDGLLFTSVEHRLSPLQISARAILSCKANLDTTHPILFLGLEGSCARQIPAVLNLSKAEFRAKSVSEMGRSIIIFPKSLTSEQATAIEAKFSIMSAKCRRTKNMLTHIAINAAIDILLDREAISASSRTLKRPHQGKPKQPPQKRAAQQQRGRQQSKQTGQENEGQLPTWVHLQDQLTQRQGVSQQLDTDQPIKCECKAEVQYTRQQANEQNPADPGIEKDRTSIPSLQPHFPIKHKSGVPHPGLLQPPPAGGSGHTAHDSGTNGFPTGPPHQTPARQPDKTVLTLRNPAQVPLPAAPPGSFTQNPLCVQSPLIRWPPTALCVNKIYQVSQPTLPTYPVGRGARCVWTGAAFRPCAPAPVATSTYR